MGIALHKSYVATKWEIEIEGSSVVVGGDKRTKVQQPVLICLLSNLDYGIS